MTTSNLVGLNTKWYRYQNRMTQEKLADKINCKVAYLSTIESGNANITSNTIDTIAKALKIHPKELLEPTTAKSAKKLPTRVDMYKC